MEHNDCIDMVLSDKNGNMDQEAIDRLELAFVLEDFRKKAIRMAPKGVDFSTRDNDIHYSSFLLHLAVKGSELRTVLFLLGRGVTLSERIDKLMGRTPLHYASGKESDTDYYICQLLLDRGADPNYQDTEGETPFKNACKYAGLRTVKLLLNHGADIRATDGSGNTALHWAAENKHLSVLKFIIDKGIIDIEDCNYYGISALYVASGVGFPAGCELLLSHGAIVDRKCSNGFRPLVKALTRRDGENSLRIMQILLENGANVTDRAEFSKVFELAAWGVLKYYDWDNTAGSRILAVRQLMKMDYLNLIVAKDDRPIFKNKEFYKEYYKLPLQDDKIDFDVYTESANIVSKWHRKQSYFQVKEQRLRKNPIKKLCNSIKRFQDAIMTIPRFSAHLFLYSRVWSSIGELEIWRSENLSGHSNIQHA